MKNENKTMSSKGDETKTKPCHHKGDDENKIKIWFN